VAAGAFWLLLDLGRLTATWRRAPTNRRLPERAPPRSGSTTSVSARRSAAITAPAHPFPAV